MTKRDRLGLRTWIEIDRQAIKHNYDIFRKLISKNTRLMGVVKSNAYGHNITEFAQELVKLGVDYFAVDSVVEGVTLRKVGIKIPILVLGYTLPEMIKVAVENNLQITISSFEYFNAIEKLNLNKKVLIHLKVDTSMHRHGFQPKNIAKVLKEIKKSKKIKVVGLYTHFAAVLTLGFVDSVKKQTALFSIWQQAFKEAGLKVIEHTCATAGTIVHPEAHFDMVRVGIGMYGIWPSPEVRAFSKNKLTLKSVLSWRTVVAEINNIKSGERVSYDFTEKLNRDTKVAILPIGYWHGLSRALSGDGQAIINGQKVKILGRVCMDITLIDVTEVKNVKVGDVVTVIGENGMQKITVDDMAVLIKGSNGYEVPTRINSLIKRIYS